MTKMLKVTVGTLEQAAARFVETWHQVESGEDVQRSDVLTFSDLATFLAVMTPTRWELLRTLHTMRISSIRALAKKLERDYKNVYRDVHALEAAGFVERSKDHRFTVPWDAILAEVDLKAA